MIDSNFKQPVFVKDGLYMIQEIGCVMDAIEYLEQWPVEKRGLIHEAACEACYAAHDGRKPIETARKAFMTWARRVGILEDFPVAPEWMTGPKIGGTNLSA